MKNIRLIPIVGEMTIIMVQYIISISSEDDNSINIRMYDGTHHSFGVLSDVDEIMNQISNLISSTDDYGLDIRTI